MAATTDAMIFDALSGHLDQLTFSPALQIARPNVAFPSGNAKLPDNYLQVDFLPNQTRQITLGGDAQQKQGLLQVTAVWKRGVGMIKPLDAAGKVIDHFKDQTIWAGEVRIIIYNDPWAAPAIQDEDRVRVPVTIPYLAFEPET